MLLDEVPNAADDGFDEITRTYLVRTAVATVKEAVAALFPKGKAMVGDFWVRNATGRCVGVHLFVLEVVGHGRLGGLRYNRTVDAVVQQSSASNITISDTSGYAYPSYPVSVRANEAALTCTISYVTTESPSYAGVSHSTGSIGGGYPDLPAPPDSPWGTLESPTYVYPAGWLLEARKTRAIKNDAGVEVCWHVQDIYAYYHPIRPGGN